MSLEITRLLITLWPLFLVSFLIFAAIINGIYIQGIIYFCGILLCILIWFFVGSGGGFIDNPLCEINTFRILGYNFTIPHINTVILWYTNAYIIASMFSNGTFNSYIFSVLVFGSIINFFILRKSNCIDFPQFFISAFVGSVIGILWFLGFLLSNNKTLLYLTQYIEKAKVCSVPKKQEFRCRTVKRKLPV